MLLSALFVRYRDIEPIWDVVLQMIFYATPIFYPSSSCVEGERRRSSAHLLMLNPFAAMLQQARHAFIDPTPPERWRGDGRRAVACSLPLAVIVAAVIVGFVVFARAAPRVAEEL